MTSTGSTLKRVWTQFWLCFLRSHYFLFFLFAFALALFGSCSPRLAILSEHWALSGIRGFGTFSVSLASKRSQLVVMQWIYCVISSHSRSPRCKFKSAHTTTTDDDGEGDNNEDDEPIRLILCCVLARHFDDSVLYFFLLLRPPSCLVLLSSCVSILGTR